MCVHPLWIERLGVRSPLRSPCVYIHSGSKGLGFEAPLRSPCVHNSACVGQHALVVVGRGDKGRVGIGDGRHRRGSGAVRQAREAGGHRRVTWPEWAPRRNQHAITQIPYSDHVAVRSAPHVDPTGRTGEKEGTDFSANAAPHGTVPRTNSVRDTSSR